MIFIFGHHCSCPNGLVTSNIAPAHPHATSVTVYPALFFLVADTRLYTLPCWSVRHKFELNVLRINTPAQPSAIGLPCIRPCSISTTECFWCWELLASVFSPSLLAMGQNSWLISLDSCIPLTLHSKPLNHHKRFVHFVKRPADKTGIRVSKQAMSPNWRSLIIPFQSRLTQKDPRFVWCIPDLSFLHYINHSSMTGLSLVLWHLWAYWVLSFTQDDDTKWLTYWVSYAFVGVVFEFSDILVSWIPFYDLLKCCFFIWLMMPGDSSGAMVLYNRLIFPLYHRWVRYIHSNPT